MTIDWSFQQHVAEEEITPVAPSNSVIANGFVLQILGNNGGALVNGAKGPEPGAFEPNVYFVGQVDISSGVSLGPLDGSPFSLLSVDIGIGLQSGTSSAELDFFKDGNYAGSEYYPVNGTATTISFAGDSLAQGISEVDFTSTNGDHFNLFLDNITVGPAPAAPEPQTVAILISGISILLGLQRFRRRIT